MPYSSVTVTEAMYCQCGHHKDDHTGACSTSEARCLLCVRAALATMTGPSEDYELAYVAAFHSFDLASSTVELRVSTGGECVSEQLAEGDKVSISVGRSRRITYELGD